MENKEYEYSFKVKDIVPYIKFCEDNNFIKVEESLQKRTLYRKEDKTMARITIKEIDKVISKYLDFKDDILTDEVLIERRETLSIRFEDDEAVESILNFLGYKQFNILDRKRIVYEKGNVKFEIDHYSSPEEMYVVAVEGEKDDVDKVYAEIQNIF